MAIPRTFSGGLDWDMVSGGSKTNFTKHSFSGNSKQRRIARRVCIKSYKLMKAKELLEGINSGTHYWINFSPYNIDGFTHRAGYAPIAM